MLCVLVCVYIRMCVYTCVYVCVRVYVYVLCMYGCVHMYLCVCCVLQQCRSNCRIRTNNKRPGPDLCSQSTDTPGKSKTDTQDDSEFYTGLCSVDQMVIRPETASFHVSVYFYVVMPLLLFVSDFLICLF